MKYLAPFFFCLFAGCVFGQKSSVHALDYKIDISHPGTGIAEVTLRCKTLGSDSTVFQLPSTWGSEFKLAYFSDLSVNTQKWAISADSSHLTCYHHPGSTLTIRYRVRNGVKDSLTGAGEVFLLHLKPAYFSAFTNSLLLAVEDSIHALSMLKIRFVLPEQWKQVTSNFGNGKELKTGTIANNQVQNGYLLAGDYRIHREKTKTGQDLTFCIRGNWSFADHELMDEAITVLDQQRLFWNDFTTKEFFISVTPGLSPNEQSVSYTGTGLMNAFVIDATCNRNVTPVKLRYLLNHELMHHWIGGKIENSADEELSYWFSEGFTDYFARLNMKNSGSITETEYLGVLDSVFRVHYSSPYREYHNDSIKVHFWDDRQIEKIPYNRGSIFALYLDNLIRKKTAGEKDLTAVMREMLEEIIASGKNRQFSRNWFAEAVNKVSGIDVSPLLDRYIVQGELIPPETFNEVMEPGLEMRDAKVFDFGYIGKKTGEKEELITEIIPHSGAAEAGLQVGDKITGYDLFLDPNHKGRLRIIRDGREEWVDFFPYKTVPVPQFAKG